MNALEQYLNDHLSGSSAALNLLGTLAAHDPQNCEFYLVLKTEISSSKNILLQIFQRLRFKRRPGRELIGLVSSKLMQLRLRRHGLRSGGLGLMEALEVLELGIRGQILLWVTLKDLALSGIECGDLDTLISRAEKQCAKVESKRLAAARQALGRI